MVHRGFEAPTLADADYVTLERMARAARCDVLRMTTGAGSGHPGGALSSLDIFLLLFMGAALTPARDRLVISHGHTAAGVYAALAQAGYVAREDAVAQFRRCGTPFEGHVTSAVPGVEWSSGNLGQGLSVGCGMALACRFTGQAYHVYVVLGDGEHQKGQLAEAQRFAAHHGLANLTAVVDCNGLQATGATRDIMRQDIAAEYAVHGWQVLEVDGHDFNALYAALHQSRTANQPTAILARTVMGKGIACIEGQYAFHGQVLSPEACRAALETMEEGTEKWAGETPAIPGRTTELPLQIDTGTPRSYAADERVANRAALETIEEGTEKWAGETPAIPGRTGELPLQIDTGTPRSYAAGERVANRAACGQTLADLALLNPLVALDCDLGASVKLDLLAAVAPDRVIQCGIQEHHTASLAGGLAKSGVLTFFADFGVFAIGETYNQQRLNDINRTPVKLIATHCGLDVGEDGKTHQCIDYIGLFANLFGWRLIVPADANQTDRALRWMAGAPGPVALAMGRSALPVLTDPAGAARFAGDYRFEYGRADWLREGADAVIITCGTPAGRAVNAADRLRADGLAVGVLNISCPLALDRKALLRAAATGYLITYEDHHVRTGLGALVGALLAEESLPCAFRRLGITQYGASGPPDDLYRLQGLDVDSLIDQVRQLLEVAP